MKSLSIIIILASTVICAYSQSPDSLTAIPENKKAPDNELPYALVAGGSKGIGYAISEALAKRNFNLILIARHVEALEVAKQKLESAYSVHVEILVYDL